MAARGHYEQSRQDDQRYLSGTMSTRYVEHRTAAHAGSLKPPVQLEARLCL